MVLSRLLFRPKASEVLTTYLIQCKEPPWTSYFVMQKDVSNDQFGQTNFNWTLPSGTNYQILRTGCFPFIKYHCSKRVYEDLTINNLFFGLVKLMNFGIPTLFYGLAAAGLITHREKVRFHGKGEVNIYFLYKEDKGSLH